MLISLEETLYLRFVAGLYANDSIANVRDHASLVDDIRAEEDNRVTLPFSYKQKMFLASFIDFSHADIFNIDLHALHAILTEYWEPMTQYGLNEPICYTHEKYILFKKPILVGNHLISIGSHDFVTQCIIDDGHMHGITDSNRPLTSICRKFRK